MFLLTFFYVSSRLTKALKRDSKYSRHCREKLGGEKLYGRNIEPVLELYTEYLMYKAILGAPITA